MRYEETRRAHDDLRMEEATVTDLQAVGEWVWLERTKESKMSFGGYIDLSGTTAIMFQTWELPHRVVSIGSRADTKGAKVGDLVTLKPYVGTGITLGGVDYVVVRDEKLSARVPDALEGKVVCDARGDW